MDYKELIIKVLDEINNQKYLKYIYTLILTLMD